MLKLVKQDEPVEQKVIRSLESQEPIGAFQESWTEWLLKMADVLAIGLRSFQQPDDLTREEFSRFVSELVIQDVLHVEHRAGKQAISPVEGLEALRHDVYSLTNVGQLVTRELRERKQAASG